MSLSRLSPEQAERAEQIFQSLRQAAEADLRGIAELLASKEDYQILGPTEFEVRDLVHRIGARAIETALGQRKGGAYRGSSLSCPQCTQPARLVAYRPEGLLSLLGPVRPRRAYYHCPHCHRGDRPSDPIIGPSAGDLTPGAAEAVSLAGVVVSFAEVAEEFLRRLAGLRASESTAQRTTEATGEELGRCLSARALHKIFLAADS